MRPHQNNECFGNYHFLWREVGLYDRLSKVLTKCTIFLISKSLLFVMLLALFHMNLWICFLSGFNGFLFWLNILNMFSLFLMEKGFFFCFDFLLGGVSMICLFGLFFRLLFYFLLWLLFNLVFCFLFQLHFWRFWLGLSRFLFRIFYGLFSSFFSGINWSRGRIRWFFNLYRLLCYCWCLNVMSSLSDFRFFMTCMFFLFLMMLFSLFFLFVSFDGLVCRLFVSNNTLIVDICSAYSISSACGRLWLDVLIDCILIWIRKK